MYNSFCKLNKINIISLKLKAYSSFYNVNDSIFLFIIEQVFTLSLHFFSSLYIIINFLNISFNYPVKVLYLDLYNCTCHSKYNCASIESKFCFLHPFDMVLLKEYCNKFFWVFLIFESKKSWKWARPTHCFIGRQFRACLAVWLRMFFK